ncbi:hypothetical protein B9Z55_020216 [Caenorhabditis nigoni]|uniref:Uncharacterized protein n=1 Tax=Caenorhabditis nigoni TaxID=1611254 RepID=A0A2G5TLT2_9PELO|nr:hypothetical protein B9Z55_020216 [Caenorhabditis nigoni]
MLTMLAPMLRRAISTLVSLPRYHKKAHRKFAVRVTRGKILFLCEKIGVETQTDFRVEVHTVFGLQIILSRSNFFAQQ